ncbi:Potassium/sodium hyperpolarization-activated cyclic nucleotide-gated channel 1 [Merluccius polli]|uniref:Potassium/sodium hyperpolarization-activated cyclic nucleotide-gated channel 1 n=1 Tax=Merluccius polli TaxID=89951 RepID=A0AA47NX95_MERPO|nr:Potassium/sodium hyperpolarization-activated cyclic nucleotide-gated channel 1 [Merluccius polli]
MKRLEMENVPSSTAVAFVTESASPGTDDLDPVHLEALDPVHLEALDRVHLEALDPVHLEAQECARQEEGGAWVIHPLSQFRRYYTLFMMVITLENLFSLPVEMMLPSHEGYSGHMIFSLFCDTMFLVDIALNFRMGILSNDREVAILDLHTIKMTYLKTWFIPDLMAAFPVDMILLIAEHQIHDQTPLLAMKILRILMFLRIVSMVRLLRVSRLVTFFNKLEMASNTNLELPRTFFRNILVFIIMFLVCHWNGCLQYFVAMVMDYPEDCWVRKENLMNGTFAEKYSFAMFRAVSHMTCVSYGSTEPPTDEAEMWVLMVSMISGGVVFTMLVANFSATMTNVDTPAKTYKNNVTHLDDFMVYTKLPKKLRRRTLNYYWTRHGGRWFDEKNLLNMVSKSLREEILMTVCRTLLKKVPMFKGQGANFINAVLPKLVFEVFQEGDTIFRKKAPGDRMFFISEGHVTIEMDGVQRDLFDGDYFGEVDLLKHGMRAVTARALTICRVFSLSADSLHQILHSFPHVKRQIEETAVRRGRNN